MASTALRFLTAFVFKYGLAIGIRLGLRLGFGSDVGERVEVSTPANSFKRLSEGVFLNENGLSPYSGDVFHEMPLLLYCLSFVLEYFGTNYIFFISFLDVITSFVLGRAASLFISESQKKCKALDQKELRSILPQNPGYTSSLVELSFLFNPLTMASCVGQTSTTILNLFLALSLYSTVAKNRILGVVSLAFAAYQGFYPFILCVPFAISLAQDEERGRGWWLSFWTSTGLFFLCWALLLHTSSILFGSWTFLNSTYGFLLSVPDLTPNVGLFWYFFTEMFDHFRLFFLWVFQVNLIVYMIPLALCLRSEPVLLYHEFLFLIGVFKSYPSVGDAGFCLSLLPLWRHLFLYVRHSFVVGCAFLCCTVLAPVMWYLWIHAGSANANFYFAITLLYSTAQIFLLTDILYAHLRREVHLKYGLEPMINGRKGKIVLK